MSTPWGVILYEAMTGRLPFHADTQIATLEQVRNQEPVPPRRLLSTVPRDLETICLKCLQKERAKRYTSAALLAADLQRQLAGEPIVARRTGSFERSWRWCRRKPLAASLLALLALAIVTGSVGVVSQWLRAEHNAAVAGVERDLAEANYRKARDVVDRLTALSSDLVNRPGTDLIRQRTLEEALALYEWLLEQRSDDPILRFETARAAVRAGTIQHELGRFSEAEQTLLRGIDILDALIENTPQRLDHRHELALCYLRLGHVFKDRFQSSNALKFYAKARDQWRGILSADPTTDEARRCVANSLLNDYAILNSQDDVPGSEQKCYQCVEWELWQPDEPPPAVATVSNGERDFGELLQRVHTFVDGKTAAAHRRRGDLAMALDALCLVLQRQHRFTEAEEACRLGIDLRYEVALEYPGSSEQIYYFARAQKNLGDIQLASGHSTLAEETYRGAMAVHTQAITSDPHRPYYRTGLKDAAKALAGLLRSCGRHSEAEQPLRQACGLLTALVGDFPQETIYYRELGSSLTKLGQLHYHQLEQYDVAIADFKSAIEVYEQLVERFPDQDDEQVSIGNLHRGIAVVLAKMGRHEECEASWVTALAVLQDLVNEFPDNEYYRKRLAVIHFTTGLYFSTSERYADAIAHYEVALQQNPEFEDACNNLAWLLAMGPDQTLRDIDRGVEFARRAVAQDWSDAVNRNTLGAALYRAGDYEEAVKHLECAIAFVQGEKCADWLRLAMAHWQLDRQQQARECRAQALRLMQNQETWNAEVAGIRIEAEEVLGGVADVSEFSDDIRWSTMLAGYGHLIAEHSDVWWLYD
ncbi:MAG: tetratricopeptide repeat protein, partial [Planctomycetia bacterium]|nr:tetratricopeptide repeat protein [Planctomycetia bacterium]